jgi:hypothetical protein
LLTRSVLCRCPNVAWPGLGAADYTNMHELELSAALVIACVINVFRTLPNALILYKQRTSFIEGAESKPPALSEIQKKKSL